MRGYIDEGIYKEFNILGEYLSLLGTHNFCARSPPTSTSISFFLVIPYMPYSQAPRGMEALSSRVLQVDSSIMARLVLVGKIALENRAVNLMNLNEKGEYILSFYN